LVLRGETSDAAPTGVSSALAIGSRPLAIGSLPLATVAYPEIVVADLETRMRELGEFIRDQRRVGHLSLRKLSEMAGISNPYLSQIERGMRKPSAEILQQIARALEISSETLYVQAGILDPRDTDFDLAGDIRRDPHINEDQKKTLIRIYESFKRENTAGPSDEELTVSR
jgi:transcriptional regulator with XRE-family HTH domain